MRDLREQMAALLTVARVTHEDLDAARPGPRGEGFVIVRDPYAADPSSATPTAFGSAPSFGAPPPFAGAPGFAASPGFVAAPSLVPPPSLVPAPFYDATGEVEDAAFEMAGDGDDAPLPTLVSAERDLIVEALRRTDGNRREAARMLGLSERTLYRKINEYEAQGVKL